MTDGSAFAPLTQLFHGDREKVRRALDVFLRVTRIDLEQLDRAYADADWTTIARLMHRIKSACQQIGEAAAGEAALALERAMLSDVDRRSTVFQAAREELERVQDRVAGYLAEEGGEGGRQ